MSNKYGALTILFFLYNFILSFFASHHREKEYNGIYNKQASLSLISSVSISAMCPSQTTNIFQHGSKQHVSLSLNIKNKRQEGTGAWTICLAARL